MPEGYAKHNLYVGIYDMVVKGVPRLPERSHWSVQKYMGRQKEPVEGGLFTLLPDDQVEGEIALVLHDDENTFMPVISFLTDKEARDLKEQLERALKGRISG